MTNAAAEFRRFVDQHWDDALTVGAWWELLGLAGWSDPTLPVDAYGRSLDVAAAAEVTAELERSGVLPGPVTFPGHLAAATIVSHGSRSQIDRYVRRIVTGQDAWCQLFSEPGAGSDLASLSCRAVASDSDWLVTGQKVWTSEAAEADMGMLLARTDPDLPKRRGISWFAISMDRPGIVVRPLRELTGRAIFNEVFLDDAWVEGDALVGGRAQGWAVAATTLAAERSSLSAGGLGGVSIRPGTKGGCLGLVVGDVLARQTTQELDSAALIADPLGIERRAAQRGSGQLSRSQRDALVRLYQHAEVARLLQSRSSEAESGGHPVRGWPNIGKLASSALLREAAATVAAATGPHGMLHGYSPASRSLLDRHAEGIDHDSSELVLFAPAASIYGGTDQVQRNIIGERFLGLPREPQT